MQEGGAKKSARRNVRLVQYSLMSGTPTYEAEWVVPLPTYTNSDGKSRPASQSEMHFAGASASANSTQFLFLPRDSGAGRGQGETQSVYRHVDVFDLAGATNMAGAKWDNFNASITSGSESDKLDKKIVPASVCPFLDVNNNAQLGKFGLRNGGAQSDGLLNEKWEGMALVPTGSADGEYFLFLSSDNDFVTQDGKSSSSSRGSSYDPTPWLTEWLCEYRILELWSLSICRPVGI
jgi:hypothetical protein